MSLCLTPAFNSNRAEALGAGRFDNALPLKRLGNLAVSNDDKLVRLERPLVFHDVTL